MSYFLFLGFWWGIWEAIAKFKVIRDLPQVLASEMDSFYAHI